MAAKTLVSLGFMTNTLGPHHVAECIAAVLKGLDGESETDFRITALISGLSADDCTELSPLYSLGPDAVVVASKKRVALSSERHKVLCDGFLENADLVLVADLDRGHAPPSIAELVLAGIRNYPASVLIPQNLAPTDGDSYTLAELALAFEDYVALELAGVVSKHRSGRLHPRLQTGLFLFRIRAVRELLKFPWKWTGSVWDIEMAYFALRGDEKDTFRVGYPELRLSDDAPVFNADDARAKFSMLAQLSGKLDASRLRAMYEVFAKQYAHLIRTPIADAYHDKVLSKI